MSNAQGSLVITPGSGSAHYWRDLWRYRELMLFLAWRDISVRYKQTAIGVTWALIRPALTMLVFVGFRRMVGVPASRIPDPLLVFAAVLPWQFFSNSLAEASNSIINNANLVSKVYFPRLLIPSAAIATGLVDFLVTLGLLALLMAWYGFLPDWRIAALPFFTLLSIMLSLGLGLLLAALNVEYRDFRYIVPFVVQFGLFLSPVAFKTADVPERWRGLYALNPMVGVIDGFRWSLLRGEVSLDLRVLAISMASSVFFLVLGFWYFRRVERGFADVI